MIQPTTPSLLAPAAARPSPRSTGVAVAFALPDGGAGDAMLLADVPTEAGGDRHDGAAPGNRLPIALGTIEEPAMAMPLAPVVTEAAALPASPPAVPRSAKFDPAFLSPSPTPRGSRSPTSRPAIESAPDERSSSDDVATQAAIEPRPEMMMSAVISPTLPPLAQMVAAAPVADRSMAVASNELPATALVVAGADAGPRPATDDTPPTIAPRPSVATPSTPALFPTAAPATSSLTPLRSFPIDSAASPIDPEPGQVTVVLPIDTMPVEHSTPTNPPKRIAPALSGRVSSTPLTEVTAVPALLSAAAVVLNRPTIPAATLPFGWQRAATAPSRAAPAAAAPMSDAQRSVNTSSVQTTLPPSATGPFVSPATDRAVARAISTSQLSVTSSPTDMPVNTVIQTHTGDRREPEAVRSQEHGAPIVPPAPQPIVAAQPAAPAGLVFGAARFAVQVADDRDEPAAPLGLASISAPQVIDRAMGVPAAAQAQIDLRQEHWSHAMIERIEMIRDAAADAANAADTRIRLIPDALGAIDVEVKRDGDTLNVRFHAEQAQTRTLLADAAPRLAEAAEARGLRLGQTHYGTGVGADAGAAGQNQQRQARPDPAPRAPVSTIVEAASADDDDTRLA